jgi:hypothetical protein
MNHESLNEPQTDRLQIICEQHKLEKKEFMQFYLHYSIHFLEVFKYKNNFTFCVNINVDHNLFANDEYLESCYKKISVNRVTKNSKYS